MNEAIELPIDGTLALHTFRPADVKSVVSEYLDACVSAGIVHVRIIHGKGTGTLREIVHATLRRREDVANFGLASDSSGWGATIVELRDTGSGSPAASDGTSQTETPCEDTQP